MNLLKLETRKRELEYEILSQYDEETGELIGNDTDLQQQLALINNEIAIKAEEYVFLLKDGFFSGLEKRIDEEIKRLKREKEWVRKRKEVTELALHNYVLKNNGIYTAELEGSKLYCRPDFSKTRKVLEDKVPAQYGKYIVEMDYETFTKVRKELKDCKVSRKINLDDVPEDLHPRCIQATIRPKVKITKNPPKTKEAI